MDKIHSLKKDWYKLLLTKLPKKCAEAIKTFLFCKKL